MFDQIQRQLGRIYKNESARALASLVRILGDLDLAEEALQEAFAIALEKWPLDGIPQNPCSWLISTARHKAIDHIRRASRGRELFAENLAPETEALTQAEDWEKHLVDDDQLRLIFYCCHPLLPLDARIALSLREVCGMATGEIARAYLVPSETMKKRLSRAKALIKDKGIPFEIPSSAELKTRMDAVMHVIYLIFNEGYSATSGEAHIRKELTSEAIFLGRKLLDLLPTSESMGLLALLLLHESRRQARLTQEGDLIPLEQQDRALWDQVLIREGASLIEGAVRSGRLGPYALQAAIASVYALADSLQETQWDLIIDYYDMLLSIHPSPIVELNRAIAVGMHEGPRAGLMLIEGLLETEKLSHYHIAYAAQADFLKQLGLNDEAIKAYQRAIELVRQDPEERYLKKQLAEIS